MAVRNRTKRFLIFSPLALIWFGRLAAHRSAEGLDLGSGGVRYHPPACTTGQSVQTKTPPGANDRFAIEQELVEQVRAAQKAYYDAAAEHKAAIQAIQPGRDVKINPDSGQLLHIRAVSELEALDKYSQAVRALCDAVLYDTQRSGSPGSTLTLTHREREVLKLIADGLSSKEVAAQLGISFRTAVCHRYRIMQKLEIHDVATLVKYAIRRGMVQP